MIPFEVIDFGASHYFMQYAEAIHQMRKHPLDALFGSTMCYCNMVDLVIHQVLFLSTATTLKQKST